jgi:hypothetical protein
MEGDVLTVPDNARGVSGTTNAEALSAHFNARPSKGARPSHQDEQSVTARTAPPIVNLFMVNGSAPELFLVTNLLNKQFIPAAITSRRALFPAGSNSTKPLKIKTFL